MKNRNKWMNDIIVNGYGAIEQQRMWKILKFIHKTQNAFVSFSFHTNSFHSFYALDAQCVWWMILCYFFFLSLDFSLLVLSLLFNSSKYRIWRAKLQFVIILYDIEEYPRRVNGNFIYMLLPPMSCIAHNDLSRFRTRHKKNYCFRA